MIGRYKKVSMSVMEGFKSNIKTFWNKNRCSHLLFTFCPVSFGLGPKQKKKMNKKQNKHKEQPLKLDFCKSAKYKNRKNQRNQIELSHFINKFWKFTSSTIPTTS